MNWWIWDRGDLLTLMTNDYVINIFTERKTAELFSKEFNIKIIKTKGLK